MKGSTNIVSTTIGNLSDLTTTDKSSLVAAINEAAAGGGGHVSVTGDGSKTYEQLLNMLYDTLDLTKVTMRSIMQHDNDFYFTNKITSTTIYCTGTLVNASLVLVVGFELKTSGSKLYSSTNNTITNYSSSVVPNGAKITFYY